MNAMRKVSSTPRLWAPGLTLLLAVGLLAALLLSLGWQQNARAEVDAVLIGFVEYTYSPNEAECGTGQILELGVFRNGTTPAYDEILVEYAVVEGGAPAATAGQDFAAVVTGTIPLAIGNGIENPAYIPVTILCDQLDEPNEQFHVVLLGSEPSASVTVNDSPAVVTIVDDDIPLATITNQITVDEGTAGGNSIAELTVTLAPVPWQPVQLQYETVPGSASFDDFVTISDGVLNIPAGAATVPLQVEVVDDPIDEANNLEQFYVELSSANGQAITVTQGTRGTVTIRDNDQAGFHIQPPQVEVYEGESSTFTVTLDTQPESAVTFAVSPSVLGDNKLTLAPTTLIFDINNWAGGLPVTVTSPAGNDNNTPDFTQRFDVLIDPVSSADQAYSGLASQMVSVRLLDDDFRFAYTPLAARDRLLQDYSEPFDQIDSIDPWLLLNGEKEWQSGRLILKQLEPGFNTRAIAPVTARHMDYSASVEVFVPLEADPYARVGLVFDFLNNREFYRFTVQPALNRYKLDYFEETPQFIGYRTLSEGPNPAINGGHGVNELRLERRGNQIYLYVNDVLLDNMPVSDGTYLNGQVGLVVIAPNPFINNPLAAGSFDNFTLQILDD